MNRIDLHRAAMKLVDDAYATGVRDGKADEGLRRDFSIRNRPSLEVYQEAMRMAGQQKEDTRFVATPWGIMDRYAQKFVET